jgi:ribosome-associated toxin RatA of RatAB toxin-antitoxin module
MVMGQALLTTVAALAATAVFASSAEAPRIDVAERDGVYRVGASFAVAQSAPEVMRVLTDYERIPEFMPDVQSSQVIERSATSALVEQTAVSKFMLFSKRVHLVLEVSEDAGILRFRDTCGKSFSEYEGSWQVEQRAGHARVEYRLTAKPSFEVPAFVLRKLLKRDAVLMIERLRREIGERAVSPD